MGTSLISLVEEICSSRLLSSRNLLFFAPHPDLAESSRRVLSFWELVCLFFNRGSSLEL